MWTSLALLDASGKVLTPGLSQISGIFYITNLWSMAMLSIIAGVGMRRLKPWAVRIESLLALSWLISWFLAFVVSSEINSFLHILSVAFTYLTLAPPLLNLPDVRRSIIFDREYTRVIDATPFIRVKPRLPLELKVASVLFLVLSSILDYLSANQGLGDNLPSKVLLALILASIFALTSGKPERRTGCPARSVNASSNDSDPPVDQLHSHLNPI